VLASGWQGKSDLKIVIGGEAVDREIVNALISHCSELWNFYGPTETTVWSTAMRLTLSDGPVLIGAPLANNRVYILDGDRQPVAPGGTSTLFIGGESLARG
jgi:non-ribosomal peptide synthetase component F